MTAAKRRARRDEQGAIVEIDDGMITNVPAGEKTPPAGEPWRAYLFVKRRSGASDVVEVEGATEREMIDRITDLVAAVGWHTVVDGKEVACR